MNTIVENLAYIHKRIKMVCESSGRAESDVRLLLATKTVAPERIKIALDCGETLIGENKIQELRDKDSELKDYPVERHFIGHLQTNKIKDVLKYASCIQSVDRLDLAQKLDQRLQYEGRSIDILVQVNTSFEDSKFGVAPDEAINLIKHIALYDTLNIKGLMTIGILSSDNESVRKCFRLLKKIQQKVIAEHIDRVDMNVLSMGMSGDFEAAIEEGSTMLRVGTSVFGSRIYPDSFYWNEQIGK
ncbi:YggS family pyridoxal phosphate-dependent enzyme [Dysgonomonas sp. HDW5A]|uniref:YggS family pyridoxal phosphate-dependent enzyme n=1 Tax=Dysgonomonas sp. HDW5A TaxID=2714926 RepID=UPI00140E0861|nr:YggS family pyridoxal phosphate-dependent enzyme [Dysgonomonas sp. HDW5A]QIK60297.1 YggS family pyridoxal phosphate-dependent enzyme [Dysgonomonas sp. HDW5A]